MLKVGVFVTLRAPYVIDTGHDVIKDFKNNEFDNGGLPVCAVLHVR
jgi:hypothetical protein